MAEPVPADEAAENAPVQPEGQAGPGSLAGPADEAELVAGRRRPHRRRRAGQGPAPAARAPGAPEIGERGVKRPVPAEEGDPAGSPTPVTGVAPHVPLRDLETLRAHYDGLDGDELADRLIRNAARVTAGIGAAGGGVAAVEWVATPSLLSAPVLLAAETVAVVAIEIKLIGELHEVYGSPSPARAPSARSRSCRPGPSGEASTRCGSAARRGGDGHRAAQGAAGPAPQALRAQSEHHGTVPHRRGRGWLAEPPGDELPRRRDPQGPQRLESSSPDA